MTIVKINDYKAKVLVEGEFVGMVHGCPATKKWNGFAKGKTPTLPKASRKQAAEALVAQA